MSNHAIPLQPLCLRHEIGDAIKERYTIREVLGAGAFGTVYLVEETIGSHTVSLACKEMHVLDDPQTALTERADALRMFQEEAFLLQTLRNPHIPRAHFESDKGTWLACPVCGRTFRGVRDCPDHGAALQVVNERYYLIMDFIEGPDLEGKLLANGGRPLPEASVIDWALQVCDALEPVHAKGFSHRDIKPANIKIQQETGQAMLVDFGLVKPSSVAGGYGTVLKRGSTGVGTLGYAPPSPQEQLQPDARTDILALGMTLYRLLSAYDPTEPEQLETMRGSRPRALNAALSEAIDGVILKATQLNVADRYPDVAALRADLRLARYPVKTTCASCGHVHYTTVQPDEKALCERCGRPLKAAKLAAKAAPSLARPPQPPAPPPPKRNPYQARIEEIRAELATPVVAPPSNHDARIQEIENRLGQVKRLPLGPIDQCPACRQAKLLQIVGQPTGQCPLCQSAQLLRRQWHLQHCPVCRTGPFHSRNLPDGQIFCPVCRLAPMHEEQRRRFGLVVDLWWCCPHCNAELDIIGGSRAILAGYTADPHGVGAQQKGQTHTIEEWRAMSGRSAHYYDCEHCRAQFDTKDGERLTLVHYEADPYGVGARHKGATFTQPVWARFSHDLPPAGGTHHCPHCHGEFDYDTNQHTMTLVDGPTLPDWAKRWKGIPVSLQGWYLAAAGKRSPSPGWLCPACHTEFDSNGTLVKLVATSSDALQPFINEQLSLEDWQRRARGIPTSHDASSLRSEMKRLTRLKGEEQERYGQVEQRRRKGLEEEFQQLYRQAILGGFVELKRMHMASTLQDWKRIPGTFIPLALTHLRTHIRPSEALRWESPAHKGSLLGPAGQMKWNAETQGMLLVTSERILFVSAPDRVWQSALSDVSSAKAYQVKDGGAVVALGFRNSPVLTGFELKDVTWDLISDGHDYPITLTPRDLEQLLNALVT